MATDSYKRTKVENHKIKRTLGNRQARLPLHPGLKTTVAYFLMTLPIHREAEQTLTHTYFKINMELFSYSSSYVQ